MAAVTAAAAAAPPPPEALRNAGVDGTRAPAAGATPWSGTPSTPPPTGGLHQGGTDHEHLQQRGWVTTALTAVVHVYMQK